MPHVLPPLPYAYNALEPHIDEQTMRLHHDMHHKAYVDGLNAAEEKLAKMRETGDWAAVQAVQRALAFHGSGHFNHCIFWENMSPKGGGAPSGPGPACAGPVAFGPEKMLPNRSDSPLPGDWAKAPAGTISASATRIARLSLVLDVSVDRMGCRLPLKRDVSKGPVTVSNSLTKARF